MIMFGVDSVQPVLAEMQAAILKGLAHPTRVKIVEMLRDGERCVCELMEELALEQSNVSQHLAVLKKLGVLGSRKDGLKMMYWVRHPQIFEVLDLLRVVLNRQTKEIQEALYQS